MSRGTGGFPVACWCYRRIWGGRQRLWWLAVESLCIMCCYLHSFEKASRVRPRKPVREIFRAQVQRGPPLCTSEDVKWKSKFLGCTTERLFEWLSLSCCVLKQWQLRIWATPAQILGDTRRQTVFFFPPPSFTPSSIPHLKNNPVRKVQLTASGPSQRYLLSDGPCVCLLLWRHRVV